MAQFGNSVSLFNKMSNNLSDRLLKFIFFVETRKKRKWEFYNQRYKNLLSPHKIKIFAILTPCAGHRLTVQNPAIRTLHMILPSYLSLSLSRRTLPLVNSRNVYQTLETLFRTGGRAAGCKGMQFWRRSSMDWRRVYRAGARGGLLSPDVSSRVHHPPGEKGPRRWQKSGNQERTAAAPARPEYC